MMPSAPALEFSGAGDLIRTHVIPADAGNEEELARAGVPETAFFLLRPDGHIGLAGQHADAKAISRYLSRKVVLCQQG